MTALLTAPVTKIETGSAPCGTAFDFELPPELEAHDPPEARGLTRDGVRLMVSDMTDDSITHVRFYDLPGFLRAGDTLVINTSATLNAALDARLPDGTPTELHLSTRVDRDQWVVELRGAGPDGTRPYFDAAGGQRITLPAGGTAVLDAAYSRAGRRRLWSATLDLPARIDQYLVRHGFPIRYGYVRDRWPLTYYQTVFTTETGSAEMPSAGRPFTPEIIAALVARGVEIVPVLLHTGVASLEEGEDPYPEYYRVSDESARRITTARREGRRVIAVGTTVVRALETVTDARGVTRGREGWTDVVVSPESGAASVDGLLTGLHEPRASHLQMLAAIAGCGHLRIAYEAALSERYLWHEFGDVHLILPAERGGARREAGGAERTRK